MYHILFHIMLTGSTAEFLEGDCEKPQPYGKGPWPCRNPICPHNLKDVIEEIDISYVRNSGLFRATFECPQCGFTYKRKRPIPKEEQYTGSIYIASYGHLWFQKLRECIVEQGLSSRRTCEVLQCDIYTVQKYAIKLGYMKPEDASSHLAKRNARASTRREKPAVKENEERDTHRRKWKQLIADNPDANRSLLRILDATSYFWLQENDRTWFGGHLPASQQQSSHIDWELRDAQYLKAAEKAVDDLRNTPGKPVWISRNRIIRQTRLNALGNKNSIERMPKTATFLQQSTESIDQWRKRKIIWAIHELREADKTITPRQIAQKAAINTRVVPTLYDFMLECLEQEEMKPRT